MSKSVFSERYRAFLAHMIAARRAAGLTQAELATRVGKPQSFVSKVENGERRLDFVEFVEVARAIGVDELQLAAKVVGDAAFQSSERDNELSVAKVE